MNYTALAFLFFMLSEWLPPITGFLAGFIVGFIQARRGKWLAPPKNLQEANAWADAMGLPLYFEDAPMWALRLLSMGCLVRAL